MSNIAERRRRTLEVPDLEFEVHSFRKNVLRIDERVLLEISSVSASNEKACQAQTEVCERVRESNVRSKLLTVEKRVRFRTSNRLFLRLADCRFKLTSRLASRQSGRVDILLVGLSRE